MSTVNSSFNYLLLTGEIRKKNNKVDFLILNFFVSIAFLLRTQGYKTTEVTIKVTVHCYFIIVTAVL